MKVVAPLERGKKPIIINDIGSTCSNIYIYIINNNYGVDVIMTIVI
jgi:hypothetical protein